MAATRLRPGQIQRVSIFDVIGEISQTGYVKHVGVLRTGNTLSFNTPVKIFHSGPPLQVGQIAETGHPVLGEVPAHLVGWIDDLEIEEWQGIQAWIEDVRTRISPSVNPVSQYRIDPPYQPNRDEVTQIIINWQYSCVGFVMRCYEEGAGIVLLHYDPNGLPLVEWEKLREIYGEILDRLRRIAGRIGIPGDGPWRIVLAGYVFHALNRPIEQIRSTPYVVQNVEEAAFS